MIVDYISGGVSLILDLRQICAEPSIQLYERMEGV
jgi:hypothetical protein